MQMNIKSVTGSGVVILGGTAGVGLETARQFVAQGARVVIVGRNPERGASACRSVRDQFPAGQIDFVQADATIPEEAVRAERSARARLDSIDTLVCTTGPSEPPRLLKNIAITNLRARIDEVILPPVHMMHAVIAGMREQGGGSIICVASDAAKVPTPGETLIGAGMAAIVMFAKAAALECKREHIRINVLTPSLIAGTPGAALIGADPFAAKMFEKAARLAHLGVAGAEDLAAMAVFLAGPSARRITGQAISINGGISVA
jgi:2-hydroxycyclohexanecarboxyl-CoA dehydrogenase